MKFPQIQKAIVSKTVVYSASFLLALGFVSCSDNEDDASELPQEEQGISEEEAVEDITMAIMPETGGFIEETQQALRILDGQNAKSEEFECGEQYEDSYVLSDESGEYAYSLNLEWDWIVDCGDDAIPDFADFNASGSLTYSSPRLNSTGTTSSEITVENVGNFTGSYLVNQRYVSQGQKESQVRNRQNFESLMEFTTEDLNILKSNYAITSGTMSVNYQGDAGEGNTYDFSATLVFTGNRTAVLTMGSGNEYFLSW